MLNKKRVSEFFGFSKAVHNPYEYPIVEVLEEEGISNSELYEFLKKYKHIISRGASMVKASKIQDSSFHKIKDTVTAIDLGNACHADFIDHFMNQYEQSIKDSNFIKNKTRNMMKRDIERARKKKDKGK